MAKSAFPGDIGWNFAGIFLFDKGGKPLKRFSSKGAIVYASCDAQPRLGARLHYQEAIGRGRGQWLLTSLLAVASGLQSFHKSRRLSRQPSKHEFNTAPNMFMRLHFDVLKGVAAQSLENERVMTLVAPNGTLTCAHAAGRAYAHLSPEFAPQL